LDVLAFSRHPHFEELSNWEFCHAKVHIGRFMMLLVSLPFANQALFEG
jgi:hypothetical protein